LEEALLHWISQYGYIGIFVALMLGIIGVPVPDETILAFSGYLVFKGQLSIVPTVASAFFGSICGVSISYLIGRSGGLFLIRRYGHKVHITPKRIERTGQWLNRSGRWGLIIGYFIPGVRHLTAMVAGAGGLKYPVFAVFAYTGGLLWSTTSIAVGFFLEKGWHGTSAAIHRIILTSSVVIASILIAYYLAHPRTRKDN